MTRVVNYLVVFFLQQGLDDEDQPKMKWRNLSKAHRLSGGDPRNYSGTCTRKVMINMYDKLNIDYELYNITGNFTCARLAPFLLVAVFRDRRIIRSVGINFVNDREKGQISSCSFMVQIDTNTLPSIYGTSLKRSSLGHKSRLLHS